MYITKSKLHITDFGIWIGLVTHQTSYKINNVITNTCNYKINHTYEDNRTA